MRFKCAKDRKVLNNLLCVATVLRENRSCSWESIKLWISHAPHNSNKCQLSEHLQSISRPGIILMGPKGAKMMFRASKKVPK